MVSHSSGTPATDGSSSGNAMFSTRFGFLMAAIGFAVGLGNIWRFPYLTGENGGGAFVLVYLACVLLIGVPILMAELLIGRQGRGSPPQSLSVVARAEGVSPTWRLLGSMNVLAAFLVEVVYAVIVGWVLRYLFLALTGGFTEMTAASAQVSFVEMQGDTQAVLGWTALGLVLTGVIIVSGVQAGIERAVRILMPMLFLLLVLLALYNVFAGGFLDALRYLFVPDFSRVTPQMLLAAIGQAFFSIGVAMAGMMTFGAYLPQSVSIGRSALLIVFGDTLVAVLAGLVIFPAVFNNGLDPASGTGLIFQTLPLAFAQMPGGYVVGVLFFLLLSVAAITSMVGLVEPINVWLSERFGWQRRFSALVALAGIGSLGLISALAYGPWGDVVVLGLPLPQLLDYVPNQILLPLGGLMIAVFAGWQMSAASSRSGLGLAGRSYQLWRLLVRYPVPIAVAVIFVTGVFGGG